MSKTALSVEERKMLKAIFTGHDCVADLVDYLSQPTTAIMMMSERLEIGGFVERVAQCYNDWLKFRVTPKGKGELPQMSETEMRLAEKYGLSLEDCRILKCAKELGVKNSTAFQVSEATGYRAMFLVPCLDNLERKGLLKMTGIWRRFLTVTDQGDQFLSEMKSI